MCRIRVLVCGASLAGLTGCTTPLFEGTIFEAVPRQDNREIARVATYTQQISLELKQVNEQVAALNRNCELLESRVGQLESQAKAEGKTSDEMAQLRRDLQDVRSSNDRLKRDITDDLAGRIEKIALQQQRDTGTKKTGSSTPTRTAPAAGVRSGYEHRVEKGQTLSEISRGYGKSIDAIMKANKITNPSAIQAGQTLFIPD